MCVAWLCQVNTKCVVISWWKKGKKKSLWLLSFSIFWAVCVECLYVCVCMFACVWVNCARFTYMLFYAVREPRLISKIVLHPSSTLLFEEGLSVKSRAHWYIQTWDFLPHLPRLELQAGFHTYSVFTWVLGLWTPACRLAWQAISYWDNSPALFSNILP